MNWSTKLETLGYGTQIYVQCVTGIEFHLSFMVMGLEIKELLCV
jgi:hypothetical protein